MINCCTMIVALITLHGVNTGLSLFNVWANTIHYLVVPLIKIINLFCDELQHLSLGTYHSEWVIVLCCVTLQSAKFIASWREVWTYGMVKSLISLFKNLSVVIGWNSHWCPLSKDSQEDSIEVFTRLMLEGNVLAAVQWLMECSVGSALKPSTFINIRGIPLLFGGIGFQVSWPLHFYFVILN